MLLLPRPVPTPIVHFTHVNHLATVARHGLVADTVALAEGLIEVEVGNPEIKERRRRRVVPVEPGGVVGDYAPFYYAPRSPMMYSIDRGGVPTYQDGCDSLVYLVTTVERIVELQLRVLFTDRNAVLAIARFSDDLSSLDQLVDWALMRATMWNNTAERPDRMELRMAECLVHRRVPWEAMTEVVARNSACAEAARGALATVGSLTTVNVRPGWYF
jgi:hypothetical protein